MSANTITPDTPITMIEAVNLALDHSLAENPDVVVFGEDVGANGGVFRATVDLQKKHGSMRVFDTPLAETSIAGMSIGLAAQGMIPVAEIQFMGFIYAAMEQLISHASRLRNRTRGRLTCPMVMRVPFGGGIHAPEHHSESTEGCLPSTPNPPAPLFPDRSSKPHRGFLNPQKIPTFCGPLSR